MATPANMEDIARDIRAFGEDLSKAQDTTKRELGEMRALIDETGKKYDAISAERIEKFAASVEAKTDAIEKGMKAANENVEQFEAALERMKAGWGGGRETDDAEAAFAFHKAHLANRGKLHVDTEITVNTEAYAEYCKHFPAYMRAKDISALAPAIQNVMHTGSDPDGGYLVPTTVSQRTIEKVYETSNLRQFATVETIGGKELEIPRDEGEFGVGGWVGEHTAPTETSTSQLGVSKIFAHEMFAEPRVTQNMLEDAGLDIEAWVGRKVGEKMGRIESTAFHTGSGVNQPRGFLTYGNGTTNGTIEQIVSGHATQFTSDAFYNLVFSLKDYYTTNARFLMKRTSVRDVMKLKDGQNNYLWQMGDIRGGVPSTLLGFEVSRDEDMPTVGADSLSVAFGDFAAAYTIVDRLGITLLRDNLTAKPYVKFYNRRRVGGDVVNFEAIKLLKTAAA